MLRFLTFIGGAAATGAGIALVVASITNATGGDKPSQAHTPVTLCHWVPAHGGSYLTITVDDDGSSGNVNLQGHEGHDKDIIPAPAGGCPQPATETPEATHTPNPTHTPKPTHTPAHTATNTA